MVKVVKQARPALWVQWAHLDQEDLEDYLVKGESMANRDCQEIQVWYSFYIVQ